MFRWLLLSLNCPLGQGFSRCGPKGITQAHLGICEKYKFSGLAQGLELESLVGEPRNMGFNKSST